MGTYLSRLPAESEKDPAVLAKRAIDGILEEAADAPYDTLVALSAAASAALRRFDAELAALPKCTGAGLVAKIREYERGERELRVLVRNHPDHSYGGGL